MPIPSLAGGILRDPLLEVKARAAGIANQQAEGTTLSNILSGVQQGQSLIQNQQVLEQNELALQQQAIALENAPEAASIKIQTDRIRQDVAEADLKIKNAQLTSDANAQQRLTEITAAGTSALNTLGGLTPTDAGSFLLNRDNAGALVQLAAAQPELAPAVVSALNPVSYTHLTLPTKA